jgi:hypothetical protein
MVSDGGGGPSDQSSGLPIDRASHESSRSRARTRSRSLKHGWYCLLEHLTFHPCRRFHRTARRHTFFVLDRMEDELLMIEQACRLPARCALLVPADSPSMGPSGRRASVSSWRDAFGTRSHARSSWLNCRPCLRSLGHQSNSGNGRPRQPRVYGASAQLGIYRGRHHATVGVLERRISNLRAVQLLLGHSKLESTVRYLGIEVDDALEMAEQTEV